MTTGFAVRAAADLIVLIHFAFVLFVVLGGFLVLRWRWVAWVHVPATIWGAAVEFAGWICPLTPLENSLRELSGSAPYNGDFVERYLLAVLYPSGLTRMIQVLLGLIVLAINSAVYLRVIRRSAPGTRT